MNWISTTEFMEKYGCNRRKIDQFVHNNKEYTKKIDNKIYIDEKKVLERVNFRINLWHYSTTIYYVLVEIFGNDNRLAKRLAMETNYSYRVWRNFLQSKLFALPSKSITDLRISNMMLVFAYKGSKYLKIYKKEETCSIKK